MKIHMPAGGLFLVVIFTIGFGGCKGTPKPVPAISNRADVFTEVQDSSRATECMVDMTVKASVKTPTPEHYLLESKPQPPGGGFPFELNVDGQKIIWKVEGARENRPVYGPSGRLPEGGEGIRYVLKKTIRLAGGPHHVVFGVPYYDYYTEVKVFLDEDKSHTLEFQPVYAVGRRGYRTFFHGIGRTLVSLDGVRIK
jgi:hypothetical protein